METRNTKGGRPKKAIRRDLPTGVRFTEQEYSIVKNKAEAAGYKLTVYIRQVAINGHVIARISGEEKQQLKALAGIANNINQMAKKAHQEGLVKAAIAFEHIMTDLEMILGRTKR